MASASDVPHKYDVVINGEGYRLLDALQSSLVYRTHKAVYSYSPTFIERSNIQGDYGDNQQDFWLTATQRDWGLGEDERYYRSDDISSRRYYNGSNVDVSTAGQVSLAPAAASVTLPNDPLGHQSGQAGDPIADVVYVAAYGSANVYKVANDGTVTTLASGLASFPAKLAVDRNFLYATDGSTVRKYNGSAWSAVSSSGADALAVLNNTLYGLNSSNGTLLRYDTAGAATTLYTWKDATGAAEALGSAPYNIPLIIPYGGRLFIFTWRGLFQYDGSGVSSLAQMPNEFVPYGIARYGDVIFLSGAVVVGTAKVRPCVYSYVSGSLSLLWQSEVDITDTVLAQAAPVVAYRNGCLFFDHYNQEMKYYNAETGGVSSLLQLNMFGVNLVAAQSFILASGSAYTTAYRFPTTTTSTSGFITTSLFDFDSTLTKYIKGVTVDADLPTGSSVDISYRLNDLSGSYTSLATGIASGTEYSIAQNARSISIRVTLNKGSSTAGPTLKRIYIRAAPILQAFRKVEYILDLTGVDGKQMLKLRDGSTHAKDGLQMAIDLNTAAQSTSPISITDRFGTFTGILEPDQLELREIRPEEFVAQVVARQT